MDVFSTRELAAGIWLAVFVIWVLTKAENRKAVWGVVCAVFATRLTVIWMIGSLWVSLGVHLLYLADLWSVENLKGTLIWSVSAGAIVLIHGFSQADRKPNYRKIAFDLFKLTVLLEVLVSTYCFSLPVELILFFLLAFATAIQVYSGLKDEYRAAHKPATGAVVLLVGIMLWGAVKGLLGQPDELISIETLKSILRPIILTVWLLPISYGLGIIAAYQLLFTPFRLGKNRTLKFKIFARLLLIKTFGLRLNTVFDAPKKLRGGLYGVYSMDELEKVLNSYSFDESENTANSRHPTRSEVD